MDKMILKKIGDGYDLSIEGVRIECDLDKENMKHKLLTLLKGSPVEDVIAALDITSDPKIREVVFVKESWEAITDFQFREIIRAKPLIFE